MVEVDRWLRHPLTGGFLSPFCLTCLFLLIVLTRKQRGKRQSESQRKGGENKQGDGNCVCHKDSRQRKRAMHEQWKRDHEESGNMNTVYSWMAVAKLQILANVNADNIRKQNVI